jgi:hypothetical protein
MSVVELNVARARDTVDTLPCLLAGAVATRAVNALFDTGALDHNYISVSVAAWVREHTSSEAIARAKVLETDMIANHGAVGMTCAMLHDKGIDCALAVNGSPLKCYGVVECTLATPALPTSISVTNKEYAFVCENVLFKVLEMPYDVIVGRATMREHELFAKLQPHFMSSIQTQHIARTPVFDPERMINERIFAIKASERERLQQQSHAQNNPLTISSLVGHGAKHVSELLDVVLEEESEYFPLPRLYCVELDENPIVNPIRLIDQVFIGEPGTALHDAVYALIVEFEHIFKDTVAPEPALFPPMVLEVDKAKWELSKNRGAPRLQSNERHDLIDASTQTLLDLGVIEPSKAVYHSHVHLVKKAGTDHLPVAKQYRPTIDFRNLNDATTSQEGYPIPHIGELLRHVGSHKPLWFAKIDATSGYHQAPLDEASRPATAFITRKGVWQYKRVPMGLKGAVSYFQRALATTVLAGILLVICVLYVDDCLIWATTDEQFLENLRIVFTRFSEAHAQLNPSKCSFLLREVEFTGHILNREGLTFSRKKIQQALDFPRPQTQKQMKMFLGLINHFRDHIVDCSTKLKPLHAMVSNPYKPQKVLKDWSSDQVKAFEGILSDLDHCPTLFFLDDDSPIVLQTDASDYGIGAYLYQIREFDGRRLERPVFIISKSLSEVQQRWHTPEKEAYAIYYALIKLRHLLIDRKFLIHTDHKNLTYLNDGTSKKMLRWKQEVAEYDATVGYIKGVDNSVGDPMSRLVRRVENASKGSLPVLDINLSMSIAPKAITDENRKRFHMVHGPLVGHRGYDKCCAKLDELGFNWYHRKFDVKQLIKECKYCQVASWIKPLIHAMPYTLATYAPMELLCIDSCGPFPPDDRGNQYVIAILDTCTRYAEFYPAPSTDAQSAAQALLEHSGRFGFASYVLSDNGSQYVNDTCDALMSLLGTEKRVTTPYSHEQNAMIERLFREFSLHLRALLFDKKVFNTWSFHYLPIVQRIYNNSVHSSTGVSPAQLLFGNVLDLDRHILKPTTMTESKITAPSTVAGYLDGFLTAQANFLRVAAQRQKALDEYHIKMRSASNKSVLLGSRKRTNPQLASSIDDDSNHSLTEFPVNSYVLARTLVRTSKFNNPWRGPFRVAEISPQGEYLLQDLLSGKFLRVHLQHLKEFVFSKDDVDAPVDAAQSNQGEFHIESILEHRGMSKKRKTLEFLVRWTGYDPSYDTWEPWDNLKQTAPLVSYLKTHRELKYLVRKEDR